MRFIFLFSLFLTFTIVSANEPRIFERIKKDSGAVILKDLNSNRLIVSKNEDKSLRPASLTKIMTCILAIESGKMNSVVTITKPMTQIEPTIVNVQVGEQFYLKDLVHAAMIKSANDAANSIAYYLGNGSKEAFIDMMNMKAQKLGMSETHFTNPCGFDVGNHYSSAKDLMRLTEYAIQNHTFNSIAKLKTYSFRAINTNSKYSVLTSNKLQRTDPNILGIKTGFTNAAGPCLIARSVEGNKNMLLVMLNAGNRWDNAKQVFTQVANPNKAQSSAINETQIAPTKNLAQKEVTKKVGKKEVVKEAKKVEKSKKKKKTVAKKTKKKVNKKAKAKKSKNTKKKATKTKTKTQKPKENKKEQNVKELFKN